MNSRIIIIGCKGFIGAEIYSELNKKFKNVVGISKKEIDLTKNNSLKKLKSLIKDGDTVVFVSAIAPCKDISCLKTNLDIVNNFISAVGEKKLRQIINISSDAVYTDSLNKIDEGSKTNPTSLHGIMHISREHLLHTYFGNILSIVRPTLVYGIKDPHNGYGPNKFRRLIINNEDIRLFGKGEELRDHVCVNDIAKMVTKIISKSSFGIFNAVSGNVMTFYEIANYLKVLYKSEIKINISKRTGPMPHLGKRTFKKSKAEKIFSNFKFKSIKKGLKELVNK